MEWAGDQLWLPTIGKQYLLPTGGRPSQSFVSTPSQTGKVGINDTAPQGKLQIDAGGDVNCIHLVNSGQSSSNFATRPISIIFGDEQKGASARHQASINCVREAWSSTPAALTFKTATGVNTATERMRITSGGNVGIGTAAPDANAKLDVDGVIKTKSYVVASLPTVVVGGIIYVSDETGGAVLAFSDGVDWRRVTDRAIVS